jgi:hypothetical protein
MTGGAGLACLTGIERKCDEGPCGEPDRKYHDEYHDNDGDGPEAQGGTVVWPSVTGPPIC